MPGFVGRRRARCWGPAAEVARSRLLPGQAEGNKKRGAASGSNRGGSSRQVGGNDHVRLAVDSRRTILRQAWTILVSRGRTENGSSSICSRIAGFTLHLCRPMSRKCACEAIRGLLGVSSSPCCRSHPVLWTGTTSSPEQTYEPGPGPIFQLNSEWIGGMQFSPSLSPRC